MNDYKVIWETVCLLAAPRTSCALSRAVDGRIMRRGTVSSRE